MQIPGYEIKETIYTGKRSSVIRAARLSDKSPVVLRVNNTKYPTTVEIGRFKHEYNLLKDININGVIKFYDYLEIENLPVIVMEDFGGFSLKSAVLTKKINIKSKIKISQVIAGILGEIHDKGIIHKDINPNNILINPETGVIKLIDFELSTKLTNENQQLKNPDQLEGTLAYIAPEQTGRVNRPVTRQSDIYSLGISLYELFSGQRPFDAGDNMELVHMHIAKAAQPLCEKDNTIPRAISDVIDKMIAKNPEDRYKSAHAIRADFQKIETLLDNKKELDNFKIAQMDIGDKFQIPAKLYGRESEIKILLETYQKVCSGKSELMMIEGYSGVGKSALINELHKPMTENRGYFITGKFDQYKKNIPYSSLISAFEDLIRQILTESDESIRRWKNKILVALDSNAQVIVDVIPELTLIIGPQPAAPAIGVQEAQNRFNLYLRKFIQVFAKKEHPLSIFIDDLQWADAASISMIELLATDSETRYLFFLGAFRDNEVDGSHPLNLALERIKKEKVKVNRLVLKPLAEDIVTEIIADTFLCEKKKAEDLGNLIFKKTNGNPFFINQLLKNINEEKLAFFDYQTSKWNWNLDKISQMSMSNNVIDLMIQNIQKLPAETQNHLKIASCIGNVFELQQLCHICNLSEKVLIESLNHALKNELILPIGDDYKYLADIEEEESDESKETLKINYRFLHDRVQQAAYDMLSEQERKKTHQKIGTRLLENADKENIHDTLFDIVEQLNHAIDLISDDDLLARLARLNFKAAMKAKESVAYQPALKYFTTAQELTNKTNQPVDAGFRFELTSELAETQYLCGNKELAEKLFKEALKLATNRDDKAKVYEKIIHFHTNTGNFKEAYQAGRKAVKLYGVSLPPGFVPPLFLKDLIKSKIKMRGKKIEDLINLPMCQDPEKRTAMRLIAALLKAAFQIRPELCIHNAIKAVNLSLTYGNIEDNAVPYVVFGGIFLGGVLGNRKTGYEFGRLALAMNEKFNNLNQKSEVNFVSAYFTNVWMRPAKETETYYQAAYDNGLQVGDFFHVSCAACTTVMSQFLRGVYLNEVETLGVNFQKLMSRINSVEAYGAIQATLSSIKNLRGETLSPESYSHDDHNEEEFIKTINTFNSLHFTHFYYVNKMLTLFLWGKYAEALAVAKQSEKYLKYSIAMLHTVEHFFLYALISSAVFSQTKEKKHLKNMQNIHKKINKWSKNNPQNFEHQVLLIEAELESHTGDEWKAIDLYEKAAHSAAKNGFFQKRALSNELAGRFLARKTTRLAYPYLTEAMQGYQSWGASAIAAKIALEFPEIIKTAVSTQVVDHGTTRVANEATIIGTITHGKTASTSSTKSFLDIDTVVKSTQVISGEIKLNSLLEKLMQIIVENAGAESGCFISLTEGKFFVEAESSINDATVKMLKNTPLEGSQKAPVSLVQYVARTSQAVLLDDAREDRRFQGDEYIKTKKPKSVLCSPIIRQGEIIALVYLENNLSTGVFTEGRLEMLKMISAQAAISIENARHYELLEQRVVERTRDLANEREKSENLLLNILPVKIATELKNQGRVEPILYKSASIMFTDFKGFTQKAGYMQPGELLKRLDEIFTKFDEISSKYNIEKLKTIGDAYMCGGGFPEINQTHVIDMCQAALEFQNYMGSISKDDEDNWELRVGIHTGPIIAGVIGQKKFTYDVWGDSVNIAARMESAGEPGKVNVSSTVYTLVNKYFIFKDRGDIEAKGKGKINMYFLERIKPEYAKDEKGLYANEKLVADYLADLKKANE